jgi:hypothetical protein
MKQKPPAGSSETPSTAKLAQHVRAGEISPKDAGTILTQSKGSSNRLLQCGMSRTLAKESCSGRYSSRSVIWSRIYRRRNALVWLRVLNAVVAAKQNAVPEQAAVKAIEQNFRERGSPDNSMGPPAGKRECDSLAKLCELTGVRNEFDAPLRRAISEVAFEKLDFFAVEGHLNIATRSNHSRCVSIFRSSGSRTTSRTMRHQILRIAGHDGRRRGVNALA